MRQSKDTFTFFNSVDPGAFINWYRYNRRRLVERLIRVQWEGNFLRNTKMFDDWMMLDNSITDIKRRYGTSKKETRTILEKQLKILSITWEREYAENRDAYAEWDRRGFWY